MSQPYSKPAEDVVQQFAVDPETGLASKEAAERLAQHGPNRLVEEHEIRFLAILREEITEPMILLLLAVGVLYGVINQGDLTDSVTIIAIVTVLVLVEVWNEYRAKRSVASLRKLASGNRVYGTASDGWKVKH